MNKIYASFGITAMDSSGNRKNHSIIRKELLEAIDKQVKWEMNRKS